MTTTDAPTLQLSAFAHALTIDRVPAVTMAQAKRTLLNFFGCACGGARHASVEAALRGRAPWAGAPTTALIGRAERFDPALAALLNTMASAVYSFDDTHAQALIHPGGPVAASLLAVVDSSVSGESFLLSFIAGVEAACRVSKAISVAPAKARPEWVQTGVCAGVGAALAVARLLKLDDRRTASAIGIAAARASGPRGLSRSMCFSYMAGSAAEAGLLGATSAGCGMTGPEEPLAGPQGFCACFSDNPHVGHLVADLGQRFELDANTFKPYPCGVVIHPVIEACLALAPRVRDSGEIEAIQIEVPPATARLADLLDPRDQYELQTSLQHWAACALGEGAAGVEQSQDDRLADPALTRLRRCVRILSDEALRRSAARVAVRLRSGREESARIEACQGSAENPMTDEDIERKYLAQAAPRLGEEAAHALAEACWRIDSLPSASRLMDLASGR